MDAWYVDAAQAVEPDADIEAAMGAGGAVLGAALAVGTVAGTGLVALDPIAAVNPLVVPLLVALVLRGVELVTVSQLMVEPLRRDALCAGPAGVIVAYVATMAVHGAANPHPPGPAPARRSPPKQPSNRAVGKQRGGAVGAIGLGLLADGTSLTVSILTGTALLAAAAPLYVIANQLLPHDGGTITGAAPNETTAITTPRLAEAVSSVRGGWTQSRQRTWWVTSDVSAT